MEKRTAFIKTKWKYLLAIIIAYAVGGSIGFLQSPAPRSTIDHQKKLEEPEVTNEELASKTCATADGCSRKELLEILAFLREQVD